jgi:hypothetical protein
MAGLREFSWSNRVLQWLPVAGAIGMFRLLRPAAAMMAGWVAIATVVWVATNPPFAGGRIFIGLIPTWPAYALLVAAIPALVPTLLTRLGPRVERDDAKAPAVPGVAAATLLVVVALGAALTVAIGGW